MSTENEGATGPSEAMPPTGPQASDSAPASASGAQTPDTPPVPATPPAAPPPPDFAPTTSGAPHGHAGPAPVGGTPGDQDRTVTMGAHPQPGRPHSGGGWGQQPPYGGGGDPWGAPGGSVPRKRNGGLIAAVLVAALVAGGIGGGIGFWAAGRDDTASTTVSAPGNPEALNRKPTSVSGIAQKALPSVVTIEAQGMTGEGGTGTGFIYDKQGHILTNNHVVASAAEGGGKLTVTFSNGKKYDAEAIGRAEGYDVAVIKLKHASDAVLQPLPLGRSANVQVGDATIAIGAPFGLSGTVTTGIISAKDRPVASSDGGGTSASYMSALQTDASINPGNSGGPLMDAGGNVIGINSAIQSAGSGGLGGEPQQSGSIGLGFAIPIDQAKRVAQDLIKTGRPVYPQIGVQVGMKDTGDGATIAQSGNNGTDAVTPGGPADKAGLRPGDTITKLDDTVIDSGPTLISEIWQHKPGDQVTLTYKRGGKENTAQVTLGQRTGDK
ncbi:trypsin-like peptidase domain-containing protein [Streptomyces sp. NPDC050636]|uniref:S1C family serine protease n=1 Tax=Streptomyces sp. NPDC050636 TaxID=3154510 RepID=UPI003424032E